MNDDTWKEKMFIPSFGGADDVSVGKSSYFQLLKVQGLIFVASVPRGSILDGRRINP